MSRLQQRQRRHRRRHEALNKLYKTCWLAAATALLCYLPILPATGAFFTDRAEVQASFRATTFADNLALFPGNSKTNDSPGDPGPAFDVAQTVNGQINLNFGTYPVGNNRNFPDVLNVQNISDRTLTLRWHFSGDLAQFFENRNKEIIIAPGDYAELGFKLDTRPQDEPGEYSGTLHLSALDGFITAELPVRLRLAEKQGKEKQGRQDKPDKNTQDQEDEEQAAADLTAADQNIKPHQHIEIADMENGQADRQPDGAMETETGEPSQGTGESVSPGESGDHTGGTGENENAEQGPDRDGESASGNEGGENDEQSPGHYGGDETVEQRSGN